MNRLQELKSKMGLVRAAIFIMLLSLLLVLSACGQGVGSGTAGGGENGASANQQGSTETTAATTSTGSGVGKPLKIGLLAGQTGLLEAYAKQTIQGFQLGLEYATEGSNQVAGRPIEVIIEDDQLDPKVAIEKATKLLDKDKVDFLVGTTSSAAALAVLPLAEEYQRVMIVEPAVADSITGKDWNKYIFRTGRSSTMDAIAAALSIEKKNAKIAIYAQDYAFGQDGAAAFKREAEKLGHTIIHEEFTDPQVTDHTAHIQKVMQSGADYVYVVWAGANTPWQQMQDMRLFEKVTPVTGFPDILGLKVMGKAVVGLKGFTVYNYRLPDNDVNRWLVEKHKERYNSEVPDLFTAGGFAAAMAIVQAVEKTGGNTDPETLITAMEGMTFDSPKGLMTFRKEDHQALQEMYVAELIDDPSVDYAVPKLLRTLPPEATEPPIMNRR
ncbi:MAG: Branched-chain amino acid ABC transporter, amino acid-binding protein [Candidatus Carbobacillus altaicus]|uniref:Branched-chain amino acid ABC transporter, amino acid-binding protein n=1 Tax=Candidatus Carbonibacillus altaicus TaxID=2163959 RepID=A0A2R6Y1W5_9BACL|nr:MAG: Branched-chain amino acid ABC transporter, amino acid-binding protein [Candidatus Carbobacillus altaicus]